MTPVVVERNILMVFYDHDSKQRLTNDRNRETGAGMKKRGQILKTIEMVPVNPNRWVSISGTAPQPKGWGE